MSTLIVTETVTYRGQTAGRFLGAGNTPDLSGGLGEFLARIIRAVAGVGVVLLDRWAAERLGFPVGALPASGEGKVHPLVAEARTAGWECREVWRWTRFVRGGHTVHVGLLEHMDPRYYPLLAPDNRLLDTAAALEAWQKLAGVPYIGAPADAVNAIIQATAKPKLNHRPVVPHWRPKTPAAVAGCWARTFSRHGFDRTGPGRFLVGYDATRAYLAAMGVTEVAVQALRATGRRQFDPGWAGWWSVDLAPWTDPTLPAPWGFFSDWPDPNVPAGPVWLPTPTLALLEQLHDDGRYAGFTVLDSFTSQASRAVLRPAGERLRDMWDAAAGLDDANDTRAVRDTIKAGYQAVHGQWRSQVGDILRPDWSAALVSTASANLWRRVDQATAAGYPPAYLDGIDTVWYATDTPDQPPPGIVTDRFPLNTGRRTDQLGTFRRKYVKDRTDG